MTDELLDQGTTPPAEPVVKPEAEGGDKPKGPTPEELIAKLTNLEQYVTQRDAAIGDLRKEIDRSRDELRLEREQRLRDFANARREEEPEPDFDFTKPGDSVARVVMPRLKEELDRRDQARAEYDRAMIVERAKSNFFEGQEKAAASKDPIYQGIEKEVSDMVWNSCGGNPELMRNVKTWEGAATLVRVFRGERDKLNTARPAMNAPGEEIPVQVKDYGRSPGSNVEFSPGDVAMINALGGAAGIKTREEAEALLKGGKGK